MSRHTQRGREPPRMLPFRNQEEPGIQDPTGIRSSQVGVADAGKIVTVANNIPVHFQVAALSAREIQHIRHQRFCI